MTKGYSSFASNIFAVMVDRWVKYLADRIAHGCYV